MNRLQNVDLRHTAFFFDFDGTLVDIAPHPEKIAIETDLPTILSTLNNKTDGAIAIISGRRIAQVEEFLRMPLNIAGVHGAEIKTIASESKITAPSPNFSKAKQYIIEHIGKESLLYLEDKQLAMAIHYRHKDGYISMQLKNQAFNLAKAALKFCEDDYELQFGKLVIELKPKHKNKGTALNYFMSCPAFKHRTPLCFGDDITDYAMFAAAQHYNGIAYKIDNKAPATQNHNFAYIDNPRALRKILQELVNG